jgi:hypothetical protein
MIYILIVVAGTYARGPTITTFQEFVSADACQSALRFVLASNDSRGEVKATCLPKG